MPRTFFPQNEHFISWKSWKINQGIDEFQYFQDFL